MAEHMNAPWAPRIYTPSGFVREDILAGIRALDLGCGTKKLPGSVGVDRLALEGVDVVHDLANFPWPFADKSFDLVFANHFLEHATDTIGAMEEIHRILAPRGRVVIQVPYFRSVDAYGDPTHARFFTSRTLDYFIHDSDLFSRYCYSRQGFRRIGFWYAWPHESHNPIVRALKHWIHRHPDQYDQYLSLIFPVECLTWELEVVQ